MRFATDQSVVEDKTCSTRQDDHQNDWRLVHLNCCSSYRCSHQKQVDGQEEEDLGVAEASLGPLDSSSWASAPVKEMHGCHGKTRSCCYHATRLRVRSMQRPYDSHWQDLMMNPIESTAVYYCCLVLTSVGRHLGSYHNKSFAVGDTVWIHHCAERSLMLHGSKGVHIHNFVSKKDLLALLELFLHRQTFGQHYHDLEEALLSMNLSSHSF